MKKLLLLLFTLPCFAGQSLEINITHDPIQVTAAKCHHCRLEISTTEDYVVIGNVEGEGRYYILCEKCSVHLRKCYEDLELYS